MKQLFTEALRENNVVKYLNEHPFKFTIDQIAHNLGEPVEYIGEVIRKRRLGFKVKKVHQAIQEDVMEKPNCYTVGQLSKKYNVGYNYVRRLLIREKMYDLINRPNSTRKHAIMKMLLAKHPIAEVARIMDKEYNLSPRTYQGVKWYCKQHGLTYKTGRA